MTVLSVASVTYFNSCKKDPCKDVVCNNGGTCVDGTCSCTTGYEGTNCETAWNTKFVASYSGTDVCTSGTYTWNGSITKSSTSGSIFYITNMGGFGSSAQFSCTLTNSTTFTIDAQVQNGYTILSGGGSISSDGAKITSNYIVKDAAGTKDTCTTSTIVKL
jgi:hypothetical protein